MVDYTRDLLASGMTHEDIRAGVQRGHLIRLRHGVYRKAQDPAPAGVARADATERKHLETAAVTMLQLRPGACLSHVSAGLLHNLPVPRHLLGAVHITRPGRSGKVRPGIHLHRSSVPPEHVVQSPIGPVTSLARTTADLVRTLAPAAAVACADVALKSGLDRDEVIDLLSGARAPGSVVGREVMRFADKASESVGESHSRWLIHSLGLPAPVLQQSFFTADGEFVARSDFWWPDHQLVGEFDGKSKYGRLLKPGQTVEDVIEAERRREQALRKLMIWVVRWVWSDLDHPSQFRKTLTQALEFGGKVHGR